MGEAQPMKEVYSTYNDVPWYRKNWFAIILGLFFSPPLLFIVLTGDIYYTKKDELKTYSKTAKVFLIIWALLGIFVFIMSFASDDVTEEKLSFNNISEVVQERIDPDINMIKNGVLNEYNTTTIGKAFNASFDNFTWSSFQTDKGVKIVEFSGSITQELHNYFIPDPSVSPQYVLYAHLLKDADEQDLQNLETGLGQLTLMTMLSKLEDKTKSNASFRKELNDAFVQVGDKVVFQWAIAQDRNSFETSYIDYTPWGRLSLEQIFEAIYH